MSLVMWLVVVPYLCESLLLTLLGVPLFGIILVQRYRYSGQISKPVDRGLEGWLDRQKKRKEN